MKLFIDVDLKVKYWSMNHETFFKHSQLFFTGLDSVLYRQFVAPLRHGFREYCHYSTECIAQYMRVPYSSMHASIKNLDLSYESISGCSLYLSNQYNYCCNAVCTVH